MMSSHAMSILMIDTHTHLQADLVGFREENVLQVSAFYRADVQINYLAELVSDSSVPVKESVVQMLGEFMTEMGDRYDHQTRYVASAARLRAKPNCIYRRGSTRQRKTCCVAGL